MIETFWMVLTYACNNACSFCYADGQVQQSSLQGFMPIKYAQDIIEEMGFNNIKDCLLIGGEPTLHPDLDKIINLCRAKQIKTNLITNGRKLKNKEYLKSLSSAGLDRITISVEASTAALHNLITKRNSYDETIAGVLNCLGYNLKLSTLTTISNSNYDDCTHILLSLASIGVEEIMFNCAIPSVSKTGVGNQEIIDPNRLASKIVEIYKVSKNCGAKVNFNLTIPLCLFKEAELKEMMNDGVCGLGCQMYYGKGIAFDPIGDILPCTHFVDFPIIKQAIDKSGSFVYKEQLSDIWQNEENEPRRFRQELWQYPIEKCKTCQHWGHCIGGCPLLWSYYKTEQFL